MPYNINRSTEAERSSLRLNHPGVEPKEWCIMRGNHIVSWFDTESEALAAHTLLVYIDEVNDAFFDWAFRYALSSNTTPSAVIDVVRKYI